MNSHLHDKPNMTGASTSEQGENAIRANSISLLIAGGLCLYFGFTFIADAPARAPKQDVNWWWAMDNGIFTALKITGVCFLIAAGLAATGKRSALLVSAASEFAFVLLMVVASAFWTYEARVDGGFNPAVILYLILAIVSFAGGLRDLRLFSQTAPLDGTARE